MLLNILLRNACAVLRALALTVLFGFALPSSALAQQAAGAAAGTEAPANDADDTGRPVFRICDPPPICFASPEARRAWAEQNKCRFLQDVCRATTPDKDNKGARPEDRDFWGGLWHEVEGRLVYGYEFVKGLLTGLKNQVTDLYSLIVDADDAVRGLITLGRSFYDNPQGTIRTLAGVLGQEAIDTITRATHCGAYDLGLVVGQNVSPVVMLKLAGRLSQFGGDVAAAVSATRRDFHCSSFAAGTPILTDRGRLPIERIRAGQTVLSRDEKTLEDLPRAVTEVFSRTAPTHRLLRTEFDTIRLTDEHPLWVQGKGWTEAKDVTDEDVLAGRDGDALVLSNEAVKQPLQVFNFSVDGTASYFIGEGGTWVHNAKCVQVPGGGLAAHEAAGGHLLIKHVGRSEEQLRKRFATEPKLERSSSFTDRLSAEYIVLATLNAHRGTIEKFVKGNERSLVIEHRMEESTGITVFKNVPGIAEAFGVRVVLKRDPDMPDGYLILTGFPQP